MQKKNVRFRTAEQRSKRIEKQTLRDSFLRELYQCISISSKDMTD